MMTSTTVLERSESVNPEFEQPFKQPIAQPMVTSPSEHLFSSERTLSREVLRVVEAAALAAGRLMGTGKRDAADQAAVTAMRETLSEIPVNGTIVIG